MGFVFSANDIDEKLENGESVEKRAEATSGDGRGFSELECVIAKWDEGGIVEGKEQLINGMLEFHALQLFDKMPNSEGLCDARRTGLCNAGRAIMAPMSIRDKGGGLATHCEVVDASDYLGYPKARSELWDLEEAKIVYTLTGHRSNYISVDFHPFGELFASGSLDTNLKIWDIRKKGCIHTYKGHTRRVNAIRFTPDGRWAVSGGEDNTVKLWDLTDGKLLHDFKCNEGQIQCIGFHPHEFLLTTGSADGTNKFWDLETFELIGSAGPETTGVCFLTFSPDGRALLCGLPIMKIIFKSFCKPGLVLGDFELIHEEDHMLGDHEQSAVVTHYSQLCQKAGVKYKSCDGDLVGVVEDSHFYYWKKDQSSFAKGHVWALYDDDGRLRNYGLVDAVVDFLKSNSKLYFMRYTSNALLSKDNCVGFLTNMHKLFQHMVGHVHKDELFMATCSSIFHPPFHALVKKLSLFLPMVAIQSLRPLLADILREDAQFIFGIMRVVHIIFQDGWLLIHEQEMDVPNPNEYAFTRVPSVCGTMAMLAQGKQLHAHVLTVVLDCEAMVQSALVNLHLKCGSSQEAAKIFDVTKVDDHLFDLYRIFIEPLIACYLRYIDKQLSHGRYEDGHAIVSSTIMNKEKFMFVTIDKLCTALVFKCCPIGIVEVSEKWLLDVMNMNLETMVGKIKCGGEKRLHMDFFKIHRGPLEKCLGYALATLDAICLCVQKLFLVDWAFADVPISWKDVETKLFALYFPNFMIAFIEFGFVAIDVRVLALVPQIHFSVHMWTNEALLLVLLSAIMHSQTMKFVISSILLQSPNREALRFFSNMQHLYHWQSNFNSQVCVHLCALLHAWQVTTDDGYLQLDDKLGCDLMTMDNETEMVLYTGCQTPHNCWSITYESRKSNNNISGKTCSVSLVSNSLNLYLTILLPYGIFEVGEDSVSDLDMGKWQIFADSDDC
ncbi:putative transcription factor WD40-like family [Rosa chinensis]|uniref:Putative transcription factor WD40-like family n=1 Tax=Rosa chinensis TaxID=74649 RepID=A0A2P6QQY3_ROSCH|nr:putative transcription factor WD40-like family [Rosa chinensis]